MLMLVPLAAGVPLEEAEQAVRVFLGPYTAREHEQRASAVAVAGLGRLNRVCEVLGLAAPDRVAPADGGVKKKKTLSRKRGRSGAPAAPAAIVSEDAADAESDSARYADSGLGIAGAEGEMSSAGVPDGEFAAGGRGGEPHHPPGSPRRIPRGPAVLRRRPRRQPLQSRRLLLRGRT